MFKTKLMSLSVGLALLFNGVALAATPATDPATVISNNRFGSPVYDGAPTAETLEVTAALVKAGGGLENFTFSAALVTMLGFETVNAEVAKLTKQYGKENVTQFMSGMTFVVKDGLKRATGAGVTLPVAPADMVGEELAQAVVLTGVVDDTFWSGYMFDMVLSHTIHNQVMSNIKAFDDAYVENIYKVLNQTMYDVAQTVDMQDVKLATLH